MKNKMNDYTILVRFLLKEKCHGHRGKNIVGLIPDYLNSLDKTGGWALCRARGVGVTQGP